MSGHNVLMSDTRRNSETEAKSFGKRRGKLAKVWENFRWKRKPSTKACNHCNMGLALHAQSETT